MTALVFCSAYALDQGESLLGLNGRFAPAPALQYLTFNAAGRASLTPDGFVKVRCARGLCCSGLCSRPWRCRSRALSLPSGNVGNADGLCLPHV